MLKATQILMEMMPFDKQFLFSNGFFNHHYSTKNIPKDMELEKNMLVL